MLIYLCFGYFNLCLLIFIIIIPSLILTIIHPLNQRRWFYDEFYQKHFQALKPNRNPNPNLIT